MGRTSSFSGSPAYIGFRFENASIIGAKSNMLSVSFSTITRASSMRESFLRLRSSKMSAVGIALAQSSESLIDFSPPVALVETQGSLSTPAPSPSPGAQSRGGADRSHAKSAIGFGPEIRRPAKNRRLASRSTPRDWRRGTPLRRSRSPWTPAQRRRARGPGASLFRQARP